MTQDEINAFADALHGLAARHGSPLPRETCVYIVSTLFAFEPTIAHLKPGDVARLCRDRYDEEDPPPSA